MGTDWVTLLDRRLAEEIRLADGPQLASLGESRRWSSPWVPAEEMLAQYKSEVIQE